MGALLRICKTTTGTAGIATTAAERFIDTFTSEKAGELPDRTEFNTNSPVRMKKPGEMKGVDGQEQDDSP